MSRTMRDMPAWGISLVVNLSILAAFHFIVYEANRQLEVTTITSVVDDTQREEEYNFTSVQTDQIGNEGSSMSMTPTLKQVTAVGQNDKPLQEQLEEAINPELQQLSDVSVVPLEGKIAANVEVKGATDSVAGGVEGAMDRVAFEIKNSVRERKTLVIWLFDASGSLNERRDAIAKRFDNIYKQLDKMQATQGVHSVVASYGLRSEIHTPEPIQDIAKLSEIVRKNIKQDDSGVENVFGALKMTLEKFRTWRRFDGPTNKLVFIVTDERGDDAEQYLEEVIALAKRSQTKVYTIGHAAPFGQKVGYIRWTYEDGFQEDIPVDQGPETAFPDGVQLPFIGSDRDWRLKQMSSSYGPYALTRLSAETGGIYLLTDETRGHTFDRAIMRRYAPDYRPVRVQEQEIKKHPSKAALVAVAGMTYDDELPVPELVFRAWNDNLLRTELTEAQRPVAVIENKIKRLYDGLAVGEKARDTLREPRWQAAYDLAMGRVLAMRVRYFGYNQMLANMKVNLKAFENPKNNMWRLVPAAEIDTGPQTRKAAEDARKYLKRVVDEHPGTPWALMAERELSTELGWKWEEFSMPIPGTNETRVNEEQARLLLADEEERMRQQRAQAAKPRPRPKL